MRTLVISLLMLTVTLPIYADRGSIPFKSRVQIFEPNQRALIAFNGREEIMVLSTDLYAAEPTKILEVFPLPSEPVVKKGDIRVFERATTLINTHLQEMHKNNSARAFGGRRSGGGTGSRVDAGRLTFHKQIGAHDISTVHVENDTYFVDWVNQYLQSQGVGAPEISTAFRKIIEEYIQDNYRWFVFDVVSLGTDVKTLDAIQYRFKTNFLFYPMRISRTEQGESQIKLMILSRSMFDESQCLGLPLQQIRMLHQPVTLSGREVLGLSREMFFMLGSPNEIVIRQWSIRGWLKQFQHDVIFGDPTHYALHLGEIESIPIPKQYQSRK